MLDLYHVPTFISSTFSRLIDSHLAYSQFADSLSRDWHGLESSTLPFLFVVPLFLVY